MYFSEEFVILLANCYFIGWNSWFRCHRPYLGLICIHYFLSDVNIRLIEMNNLFRSWIYFILGFYAFFMLGSFYESFISVLLFVFIYFVIICGRINVSLWYNKNCDLEKMQTLDREHITSLNMGTVRRLAENFLMDPMEYMPWLIECCSYSQLSKTLFFLVVMQLYTMQKNGNLFSLFHYKMLFHPAILGIDIGKRSMLLGFRCFHDAYEGW